MNCPNCNGKIIDGCCINCGYLINGNKIDKSNETEDKYFLQKMFNDDFDTIYRNKNIFLVFILGPLYFSYRGYFIIGTMLTFIDFLIYSVALEVINVRWWTAFSKFGCKIHKTSEIFPIFAPYIIMYKAKENGKSEKQQPIADRVEGWSGTGDRKSVV